MPERPAGTMSKEGHLKEWVHMESCIVTGSDGKALESCPGRVSQQGQ